MNRFLAGLAVFAAIGAHQAAQAQTPAQPQPQKPTIVLVHGAFAESASWNGVIRILERDGFPVVAAANPLRGVASDGDYVARLVAGIRTPVVLVGHSYAGMVISNAATGQANVRGLVFVSAFAPERGETAAALTGRFPGSTLVPTLAPPVALAGGGSDLYIQQDKFPAQFAADVPVAEARLMAATQRPIAQAAFDEAAGEPAWKTIPSWFVYGENDRNIPPQLLAFMAERARSRQTVVVKGASHVALISHADVVARLIQTAAVAQ